MARWNASTLTLTSAGRSLPSQTPSMRPTLPLPWSAMYAVRLVPITGMVKVDDMQLKGSVSTCPGANMSTREPQLVLM